MGKEALSDAERQRRRRQKLKTEAAEAKFAPEGYIAEAVRDLALSGEITETLLGRIREESAKIARMHHPEMTVVHQKYLEKQINQFLTTGEKSNEPFR